MPSRLEETKIATRYARALYDQAEEAGVLPPVREDLAALGEVVAAMPELLGWLANPAIPQADKAAFVQEQLAARVHPLVAALLRIMLENERMPALALVANQFTALYNERHRIAEVEVVTAYELAPDLEDKLRQRLQALFGFAELTLAKRVDPGILGGMIVKLQDRIIDGSYMGRLESLRKHA